MPGNKSWKVTGKTGFDALKQSDEPIPQVGDKDVLVRFHGASLNYRDLIITKGQYPFPLKDNVVAGSDGAGVVEAVGSKVNRFKKGDKVITLFNQGHIAGSLDEQSMNGGVGGVVDGTLRQYGSYDEQGLVHAPSNLDFVEASTLTCAGLTAWNALYGLKQLMPGDWVLTEGTGGVSIFALQFAKAAGAKVIATTSSAAKGDRLKKLGADHVLNYKEDTNWGETAKKLTGGRGVQHVVEVGGPNTLTQALKAIAIDGVISIIGFLGGVKGEGQPSMIDALMNICTIRGVLVGSRHQFEDMNRAVEANNIKPVVDESIFKLDQVPEAYQYQWDQKHFGKVGIKIE
ncbi:Zinc-type alcohol dehydrogenase-like protein [Pseudocercospora fuligena]|uniref:Zinc-type alcohol dehydrogenase-like protein n=1 Tax=Pseudocercospora fuligena TaxID=685502 RepID=A0A8H6RSL9_9PEZI|nr:Zinc-type alcohol dehydrogenase-like protein [Pseudocercospora fuligena]